MKSLVDHLAQYATYHRDRRNIATHFVGIPTIVIAVDALLARASLTVSGFPVSAALVATVGAALFYFALDRRFGVTMTALLAVTLGIGSFVAAQPFAVWLLLSLGLFIGGWALQFLGHFYEGKKPAFVDDLAGFLVGPLFVVAEVGFALGLRDELREEIERRAGPTRAAREPKVTQAR
jgi:uncharacterized membrane protein YGL010W